MWSWDSITVTISAFLNLWTIFRDVYFIIAKDEEIAHFKEIISAKDKEIAGLKEKLSELQQNRQENEIDFAKQLNTTDEELKKLKEHIVLAKENVLKKKAEMEKIPKEELLFNGKWLPYT